MKTIREYKDNLIVLTYQTDDGRVTAQYVPRFGAHFDLPPEYRLDEAHRAAIRWRELEELTGREDGKIMRLLI